MIISRMRAIASSVTARFAPSISLRAPLALLARRSRADHPLGRPAAEPLVGRQHTSDEWIVQPAAVTVCFAGAGAEARAGHPTTGGATPCTQRSNMRST